MKKLITLVILLFAFGLSCPAQRQEEFSENGWWLPTHDTLRILLVFADVDYDVHPENDPHPKGYETWRPHSLPAYADKIFAPRRVVDSTQVLSWYYHQSSMGNFTVLGDFYPEMITMKESEAGGTSYGKLKKFIAEKLDDDRQRKTQHGQDFKEFDNWKNATKAGQKKVHAPDEKLSVDHVMIISRNLSDIPTKNGRASRASLAYGEDFTSDTYSIFGSGNDVAFGIMKHELSHLLIGGNNFHNGGGNSDRYTRHFLSLQGGWGMMGAANSSLLTCNGWDRWWLGWPAPGTDMLISGHKPYSKSRVSTDLNFSNPSDTGVYILQDFTTRGDVMRIKLPTKDENQAQYLWLENHRGRVNNGSSFDKFHYGDHDCMQTMKPGIYAYLQVATDRKKGRDIYHPVYSDFLRTITADGAYDRRFMPDSQSTACVNNVWKPPFTRVQPNALSGTFDQEFPMFYMPGGQHRLSNDDVFSNAIELHGNPKYYRHVNFGMKRHAFTSDDHNQIAIGTNPSSAVMRSYKLQGYRINGSGVNRAVIPNGLSVKLLKTLDNGSIKLRVRFDEVTVNDDIAWRADSIEIHRNPYTTPDFVLGKGVTLLLDQGLSPTRIKNPQKIAGQKVFAGPTHLVIQGSANVELRKGSNLLLKSGSRLTIKSGGRLQFDKGAQLTLRDSAQFAVEAGAEIAGLEKAKVRVKDEATWKAEDEDTSAELEKAISHSGCFFGIFR